MLLVVFGAGASYDSSPDYKVRDKVIKPEVSTIAEIRPPLANDLFKLRPIFTEAAQSIRKCQAFIDELRYLPSDRSVEQELEKRRRESLNYPEGQRQLVAIRFYLQWIIRRCQSHWNNVLRSQTTYRSLIGRIDQHVRGKEPVCFVTFNYDTLLEEAFTSFDIRFEKLDDFVSREDYKVIKLHGSTNWAREFNLQMQEGKDPYTMYTIHDHLQLANYLVSQADKIQMRDKFHLIPMDFLKEPITSFMESPGMEPISPFMKIPGKEPQGRAQPVLPAISIPLENKEQGYECPQDHLDHLTRSLSKVDKLLIVGWKAAEKDFVTLLTMGLPKDIQKAIVSSSLESAKRTCSKLTSSGLEREGWFLGEEGFTNLIQSGWIENFVSGLGEPY